MQNVPPLPLPCALNHGKLYHSSLPSSPAVLYLSYVRDEAPNSATPWALRNIADLVLEEADLRKARYG